MYHFLEFKYVNITNEEEQYLKRDEIFFICVAFLI
jgi:hypothetical protein